jgi:hypothetical protein
MKKHLLWFFGLAIFASFTFTSCDTDPCKDVDCGSNGTCFDGECVCNQGYEGTNCDATWAAKFSGNWNATDVCTNPAQTYTYIATVSEAANNKLTIKNFGGFDLASSVDFELTESGKINMSGTDNGARVFTGEGTYDASASKITYSYTVKFSDGTTDTCTGVMTK